MVKLQDNRRRIDMTDKATMLKAFHAHVEDYVPTLGQEEFAEEGGTSEISYQNLLIIMQVIIMQGAWGKPQRVEVSKGEVVLVHWEQGMYLASGFATGYHGTGPFYFARFGEKAGFGDFDDLYDKICTLPRKFTGTIWTN
jgi:hypothetical protein